jgi:hypothetical protein
MPYTATKITSKLSCADAINSIGAWAIGPTQFASSTIYAPNLFCFQTINTASPGTPTQISAWNGSGPQGQATQMKAADDSADAANLYQTQIVANAPTLLQTQYDNQHNQIPDGFYQPLFGPTLDAVLVQASLSVGTAPVQVYVLYGKITASTDAYLTSSPPSSNTQSLPPAGYASAISSSDAARYVFCVGDFTGNNTNDLFCIMTANTGSGNVEVTILQGWALSSKPGNYYNSALLSSVQISIPDTDQASTKSTAQDYHWLTSKCGGSSKSLLYAVKVKNLSHPENPGGAVELYKVDLSQWHQGAMDLTFVDFLQIKDAASGTQYDADYALLNFHWVMSDSYGLYGINTHNADNPDQHNVEVWKFKPQQQ